MGCREMTEFVNNVAWERWKKKIPFCGDVKLLTGEREEMFKLLEGQVLDYHDLEDREKSVWLLDLANEDWRLGKALQKLWSRRFTARTP